jgi:hypothetical protein
MEEYLVGVNMEILCALQLAKLGRFVCFYHPLSSPFAAWRRRSRKVLPRGCHDSIQHGNPASSHEQGLVGCMSRSSARFDFLPLPMGSRLYSLDLVQVGCV